MTYSSLKGRRILVTGYDLEQGEHRGIAVFSKALIRCLNEAGAEVWLLTGFSQTQLRCGTAEGTVNVNGRTYQ